MRFFMKILKLSPHPGFMVPFYLQRFSWSTPRVVNKLNQFSRITWTANISEPLNSTRKVESINVLMTADDQKPNLVSQVSKPAVKFSTFKNFSAIYIFTQTYNKGRSVSPVEQLLSKNILDNSFVLFTQPQLNQAQCLMVQSSDTTEVSTLVHFENLAYEGFVTQKLFVSSIEPEVQVDKELTLANSEEEYPVVLHSGDHSCQSSYPELNVVEIFSVVLHVEHEDLLTLYSILFSILFGTLLAIHFTNDTILPPMVVNDSLALLQECDDRVTPYEKASKANFDEQYNDVSKTLVLEAVDHTLPAQTFQKLELELDKNLIFEAAAATSQTAEFNDPQLKWLNATIKTLKNNLVLQKNGRKTSRNSMWKVDLLDEIALKINTSTDELHFQTIVDEIRAVCKQKRNTLHFWAQPYSLFEFEAMLASYDSNDLSQSCANLEI